MGEAGLPKPRLFTLPKITHRCVCVLVIQKGKKALQQRDWEYGVICQLLMGRRKDALSSSNSLLCYYLC